GGRPGDKVGGEAGGAECGGQVKKSDHQTVLCSVGVGDRQISHGDQGAYDDPAKVEAKFCIRKVVAQTFLPPDEEVQGEVCTGNQDEDGADQQDSVALKVTDALIVGGKSAVGDGGKGMTQGFKPVHSRRPVGQTAGQGEHEIDQEQCFGGFGNPWCELVVIDRSRRCGAIQLHTTDAQHGQNRDRDHDNPDPAKPLQLMAVVQDGGRQLVQPADDGGAGGGEPGDCFKHGVGKRQAEAIGEDQRQRPEGAQY